jgi:ERCC4-related helicase
VDSFNLKTAEISPHLAKLNFSPSLNEQLLLSKLHDHNMLIVYLNSEPLMRMLSLITLFYLNMEFSSQPPPKVLLLMKRNIQQSVQSSLKTHLKRSTTVHNSSILPNARRQDYNRFSVILSTPKIIKNDLNEKYFTRHCFSLIIILNAEMGSSSRLLRFLANKFTPNRIIGFTQITNNERLEQICKNLHIKEVQELEEIQTAPQKNNVQYYSVPLPQEYFFVLELLDQLRKHELAGLQKLGYDVSSKSTFREINAIHESIKKEGADRKQLVVTGNLQRIMKLQQIIISQGFRSALNYFDSLETRLNVEENFIGKKAIIIFLNDIKIRKLREFLKIQENLLHPKTQMILKIICEYKSGISIVTHNYDNARFLKQYLEQNGFSNIVQIDQPISSMSQLKLEKALSHFTEEKSDICITNSINSFISGKAKVIIAYDANAEIIGTLNELNIDIPKVFLLAKQTNEEARFFYLKRLGTRNPVPELNLSIVNRNLSKNIEPKIKESSTEDKLNLSNDTKCILTFSSLLFEYGIPYTFSKKVFSIILDKDISYPGFIINSKTCLLILTPETIEFYTSEKLSSFLTDIGKQHSSIYLVISPNSLDKMSFQFRYNLFQATKNNNFCLFFLMQEDDLNKLVTKLANIE